MIKPCVDSAPPDLSQSDAADYRMLAHDNDIHGAQKKSTKKKSIKKSTKKSHAADYRMLAHDNDIKGIHCAHVLPPLHFI